MEYNTKKVWQERSTTGIEFEPRSLYDSWGVVKDPRAARGKRYSLRLLCTLIMTAKLCGADNPVEIADWAKHRRDQIVEMLGLTYKRMPHHSTYRWVFEMVAEEELEASSRSYLAKLSQAKERKGEEQEIWAMDGKALRGTREAGEWRGEHMLSIYAPGREVVVAQIGVECKENEISAAPELLKSVELKGKIVTADAMHTQTKVVEIAIEKAGEYVLPVKENQKFVYEAIKKLFAPDNPKPGFGKIQTDFETDVWETPMKHGRKEKRVLTTSCMLNEYVGWKGLEQVYKLERCFSWMHKGKVIKESYEVEYGITSLERGKTPIRRLNKVRRQHWGIETKLHYRRDVTFHEDATRMTKGDAGRKLAIFNNLALGILSHCGCRNAAEGRRFFAAHPDLAFKAIFSENPRL